jgi:hypothetical protein
MQRYWLSRLIIALEVLVLIVVVSWFEESSLTARAIQATGHFGWALIAALFVCCSVAVADVVVNDLMPERFHLPTALNLRNIGFMGMALLLAMIGVLVGFSHGYTPLLYAYWLNALFATAVSFFDIFSRFRR